MKRVIVVLTILSLASMALAVDLTNNRDMPMKRVGNTPIHQGTPDGREGGETVGSAFVIPSLPYSDTGNTCDNIHDYDEVCDFSGSESPDVVYSFTPMVDMILEVDLCGSAYDTKTYVYDSLLGLVACNDDYYPFGDACGSYVSYLSTEIFGGETYYIVVDGYGGDCGDYVLDVQGFVPSPVECPADAVPEGEPALYDGYVDMTNGGCNSSPYVYGAFDWINEDPMSPFNGEAWLCANSGWFLGATGGNSRDTDWFLVTAAMDGVMEYTLHGEYGMQMYVLNTDCDNIVVVAESPALPLVPTTVTWDVTAGEQFVIWAGPSEFTGPVTNFTYYARVSGNTYNVVPNEDATWSQVKSMFR